MIESTLVSEKGFYEDSILNRPLEQYAYMCDLKRTLDATVSIVPLETEFYVVIVTSGTLRTRDAFRNWQDCVSSISDRVVPTGEHPALKHPEN